MSEPTLHSQKRDLRNKLRQQRALRVEADFSPVLTALFNSLETISTVLAFSAFRTEPNPETFLKSLSGHVRIFLPVIADGAGEMDFFRWQAGDPVQKNRYGIFEPVRRQEVYAGEKALILVPGLAFDRNGIRLGYGGGYYDRFIPRFQQHLMKAGICYEDELLETLPHGSHDQRMDVIVTDKNLFEVSHEA